jgi:hypothetical protein
MVKSNMSKAKRLAITIAGAVSLGTYEAGVLYEIIKAIGEHNVHPDTKEDERIEIDVITGASAGGMTAVIAAQRLLYGATSLGLPGSNSALAKNNPFYNPWVVDVGIDKLLKLEQNEPQTFSVLSSNLIESIAEKYVTARYSNGIPLQEKRHPAAAAEIRLGLALSNLNGVNYSYPMAHSPGQGAAATFAYTRYQDEKDGTFADDGKNRFDTLEAWEPWRQAAVSCGAFPFAFRVKELRRLRKEFSRPHLDKWEPDPEKRNFAYTDGGLFQNEPLGMAKNLVDKIDKHLQTDSRFFLYVAPGRKTNDVNVNFLASEGNFLAAAQAIVGAVFHQARFQDWIEAEQVNGQIHLFNERARQLSEGILAGNIHPASLRPAVDELLPGLFSKQRVSNIETREEARERLKKQFGKLYEKLVNARGPSDADSWIDAILVFETAAELNFKDEMTIYGITASDAELAGHGLFAFEGFFDRALREHDYNLGRRKAREFLAAHRNAVVQDEKAPEEHSDIGPIRYNPDPRDAIVPDPTKDGLSNIPLSKIAVAARQELLEGVVDRVDALLKSRNINWLVRFPLKTFFLRPELKKILQL